MLLEPLLDLPFLALSNGQTRRARIVKAILEKPELLLLGEPLSTSRSYLNIRSDTHMLLSRARCYLKRNT